MPTYVQYIIGFIAALHLFFLYFEMFAWTTIGRRTFTTIPKAIFEDTKAMAANQGVYSGFLAAGLIWSLLIEDNTWQYNIAVFFLACVMVAGIFGGFSITKKIFIVQALPACVALILLITVN